MSIKSRVMLTMRFACAAGFTLIELMVVLTLAGILSGIAIPNFIQGIRSNRLTTAANNLVTALNLARSEAVKRSIQVVVRTTGAATIWETGWTVFVDTNGNFTFDGTDVLLMAYPALPNGYTLRTGNATTYRLYAAYTPSGLSTTIGGAGDVFSLCSSSGNLQRQRTITISATGRPSVADANLVCP